jgi:cytochrome c6
MKNCNSILPNWRPAAPLFALAVFVLGSSFFSAPAYAAAADTFKSKCAMCHGADGAGTTPMGKKLKLKDLRSAEVQKKTDAELTTSINDGKVPMPAYGKTLSKEEIQGLVAYVRSIASAN